MKQVSQITCVADSYRDFCATCLTMVLTLYSCPACLAIATASTTEYRWTPTEAVLDDYFFHQNTAPFIARLLIQRFNIASNPAPAYVAAVATAFRSGSYSRGGKTFGSGNYGDLGSTIAAIFLCPESTSATLDGKKS